VTLPSKLRLRGRRLKARAHGPYLSAVLVGRTETERPRVAKRLPYWPMFLLLIAALYGASVYVFDSIPAEVVRPYLQLAGQLDADGKLLNENIKSDKSPADIVLDQLNLLIQFMVTLNTSLASGALLVAVKGRSWNADWGAFDMLLTVLVLCGSAAAYYGIYLVYAITLEMVSNGYLDPFQDRLQKAMSLQYHAFFGAFVLLGVLFCRIVQSPVPAQKSQ
jgi:hypothetical protein